MTLGHVNRRRLVLIDQPAAILPFKGGINFQPAKLTFRLAGLMVC
jgi:hypothetical protein